MNNKANVANFNMLQSAGAGQSMQAQNDVNAQMAKFNRQAVQLSAATTRNAARGGSLGMTPHDTSTAGRTTSQTTTPTDWASIISKGASAAPDHLSGMMPSDKTLKKDITPASAGPAGIPVYKYRFKGQRSPARPSNKDRWRRTCRSSSRKRSVKIPGSGGKLQIHMPTLEAATEPRGYAAGTSFARFRPSIDAGFTTACFAVSGEGHQLAMSAFMPPIEAPSRSDGCADAKALRLWDVGRRRP